MSIHSIKRRTKPDRNKKREHFVSVKQSKLVKTILSRSETEEFQIDEIEEAERKRE